MRKVGIAVLYCTVLHAGAGRNFKGCMRKVGIAVLYCSTCRVRLHEEGGDSCTVLYCPTYRVRTNFKGCNRKVGRYCTVLLYMQGQAA